MHPTRPVRRRAIVQAAGLSLLPSLTSLPSLARAQTWPARPLTLVVAFAPGGAGDTVARLLSKRLGERLGQPVVIENRPIPVAAVSAVARAKPDGYTLLMAGSGTALTSSLFAKLPYDLMADFIHVSTLASFDLALVTGPAARFTSLGAVLAFAKANPGRLTIGTARIGSTQNLAAEMLKFMTGIDALIVPYKTSGELITALRAGDVQLGVEMLPPLLGQIASRQVLPLAVTSSQRFPGLPSVPTVAESGVAGYEASSWNGIAVPVGTPPAIVQRLGAEIARAVDAPDSRQTLQAAGMVAQSSTPEQMATRMRADIAKWRAVIEKAGIPKQ